MSLQTERNLFEACLGLSAGAREEWLTSRCPDATIRERVMRLLEAHDEAESRGAMQTPPARPQEQQIGPYRLLERIGEGAMGDVYLAEQSVPVLRRVAIKVIKPGMDSREVIARFEIERQTLALMSHPCIAHIIDAGTTDQGRPYFAMEYVPGIPLTKYCDRHRLTIDERLSLFLQICDAIQHAHQKGVIHRDLKPGNLLVTDLDGRPAPKVIDFGIAKAMSSTPEPSRAHTRIGHLIGTPEYMSPEQAQLSPLDVDTRSDIYSLGVVLHELLTGLLPMESSRAPVSSPEKFVQELMSHNAQPPSTRIDVRDNKVQEAAVARRLTPRQLAHRLSGDLDWIVLKALEKDRNRRYASPSELAADIRRHCANEAVLAGPPSPMYRMRKFILRHHFGIAVITCIFGSVVLFGALMWRQANEVRIQRDEARFQAQRAEASSEFMSVMLEEVGAPNKPLTPIQLLEKGVELLDRQYGGDPRFAAQMYLQMAHRFSDLGSSERRTQLLARAATIARDVGDDALVASIECTLARAESQDSRLDQATIHLQNGHAALKRLDNPPHTAVVDCLRGEIEFAEMSGKPLEALQLLEKARHELEAANDIRGLLYHAVLTDIAGIYYKLGRFKDALILNASTSEMLDRNGRGGTMARAIVAGNRATLLAVLGETRRAEAAGADAARRVEALRTDRDAIPGMAIRYATTLTRLRRTTEAIRILTDAHRESVALGNKYWTGQASYRLGMAYAVGGRPDLAMPHIEAARRLWTENPQAYADDLAELSRALAEMALDRGEKANAKSLIDQSLEQFGYPASTSRPGAAAAVITGVRVYLALGDKDQAFSLATAALKATQSVARDPKQSADVGEAQLVMAMTQKARGNRPETQIAVQHAVEALTNALGETHPLTRAARTLQRSVAT